MSRGTGMAALLLLAAALTGCSSTGAGRRSFADAGEQMCIHCNCYMPKHYDPSDKCAVCDCGYAYGKCVR